MKNLDSNLSKSTLNISYLGKSDDQITSQLIQIAESYLRNAEGLEKLSKRVAFLIAESFQNIIRHSHSSKNETKKPYVKDFFQIDFFSDSVTISSVNAIKDKNVSVLNKKIDDINELSQEDLKSLWKKTISNGKISSKGGADLGIIEMARKSGAPLQKKFVNFDKDLSIFFLGIEIIKKNHSNNPDFNIHKTEQQYNKFIKDGILLQYNGHFTKEIYFPLIEILESNFITPSETTSVTAENMTMIIELIQNASKHGMVLNGITEGTFCIHESDNQLFLRCCNYISSETYDNFKEKIEKIKSMNIAELKSERNRIMLEEVLSKEGDGHLGLLEIAIFTLNTFEYSFRKMFNNHYYYTLEIKLKENG